MSRVFFFLIISWMIFLVGCTSNPVVVNSDYDSSTNFSPYRTYQWLIVPEKITGDPRLDNPLLHTRIRTAIDQQMSEKGFSKTSNNLPDFFVNYHVTVKEAMDIRTLNDVYGYRPHSMRRWNAVGTTGYVRKVEEGTLLMDFIDAQTKSLIWRGMATRFVEVSITPEEKEKRIRDVVRQILAQYPPTKKK